MKRIVIFSGTTEGRILSEKLSENKIKHRVCVATEYGQAVMEESPYVTICKGRMDLEKITDFLAREADLVIDATHPYATLVTENIKKAAEAVAIEYIRVLRDNSSYETDRLMLANSIDDAAIMLKSIKGNILLTTGSKDLAKLCEDSSVRERIYARILPAAESLSLCQEAGLSGRQIIAMQGPFSKEMNKALIKEYKIDCLVSKESGKNGGFMEKLEAASEANIPVIIIGRPLEEEGYSINQVLELLGLENQRSISIDIIGRGMGAYNNLTIEAKDAIDNAELVFGAKRLVEDIKDKRVLELYMAKDIIPEIIESHVDKFAVVFSGDSGFYSGTKNFVAAIGELEAKLGYKVNYRILPGISSVSYLAARLGVNYSDAFVFSLHGRHGDGIALAEALDGISYNENSFMLLSGAEDVKLLGQISSSLEEVKIFLGSRLSYEDERIIELSPEEALLFEERSLYTAYIHNERPKKRTLIPVKKDEEFIREKVPMSKEVIRHESIINLGLKAGDLVYDVGSGTGSVAIEMAGLSPDIKVYALEKKPEAINLIRSNIDKFACHNIEIVEGDAAETIKSLPPADAVFIGGSGGRLKSILKDIVNNKDKAKNMGVRVVINAVSLETIAELSTIEKDFWVEDFMLQQIAVSKGRKLGAYNLLTAENPVMISSFVLKGVKDE